MNTFGKWNIQNDQYSIMYDDLFIKHHVVLLIYYLYEHTCRKLFNTRHENFHGKFSLCAENLIRSIGQKLTCRLKCSQTIQR